MCALAVSWWSLWSVGQLVGIPSVLAGGLSAVFDLAALCLVGLAQRYANSPTAGSGGGPRLALMLMLAGSIYLNVEHARMAHVGVTGAIAYSAPAAVACLLLELHLRYDNAEHRRALGRIAAPLPVLGGWAYVFFPARAIGTHKMAVAGRIDAVRAELAAARPPVRATITTATAVDTTSTLDTTVAPAAALTAAPASPASTAAKAQLEVPAPAKPPAPAQAPALAKAPAPAPAKAPAPAAGPVSGRAGTGAPSSDPDLETDAGTREVLEAAGSTAERARVAVQLWPESAGSPTALAGKLADFGFQDKPAAIRSALRRGAEETGPIPRLAGRETAEATRKPAARPVRPGPAVLHVIGSDAPSEPPTDREGWKKQHSTGTGS
jgi:hypothetical protein